MKRGRRRKRKKKKKVSSREILDNLGEDWDSEELATFFEEVDDEYSNWRTVARTIGSRDSSQCKALFDLHKDTYEDIMTSEEFERKHARELRKLKRDTKKDDEERKNRHKIKRRYRFRKITNDITELPYDIPPADESQSFANRGLPLRMRKKGTHGTKDEDKTFDIAKYSRVRNRGIERIPVEDFQAVQRMTKSFVQTLSTESRRFFVHEWFYPSVDCGYYIRNGFIEILRDYGLSDLTGASRVEWSMIRSMMGKPRRFSSNWLKAEREKLYKYRERVRDRHSQHRRKELELQRMNRSRPKRNSARQVNYEEADEEEEKEEGKKKKKKNGEDDESSYSETTTPVINRNMKDGLAEVTPADQITKIKMTDEEESPDTIRSEKIRKMEEERQEVIVGDEIDEVYLYPERLNVGDRVAVLHESMYIFRGEIKEVRDGNYLVEVENAKTEGEVIRKRKRGRPPRKPVMSSNQGNNLVVGVKKLMTFPDVCVMKLGPVMCECSDEQYEYLTSFQRTPTSEENLMENNNNNNIDEEEEEEKEVVVVVDEEEEVEGEGDVDMDGSDTSTGLSMLRERFLRNSGVLQDPNRAREFVKHPKLRQKMVFSTEKSTLPPPQPRISTTTTSTAAKVDDVDRELFGGGLKRKERSDDVTKEQQRSVEELDKSKMSDENDDDTVEEQEEQEDDEMKKVELDDDDDDSEDGDKKKKEGEEPPKKKRKIMTEEDLEKDEEKMNEQQKIQQQQQQLYLRSSNENVRFQFPPNYSQRDENHPLYNLATLIYHLKRKQRILHQLQAFNNKWIEKEKRLHPFHLAKFNDDELEVEVEEDDEDEQDNEEYSPPSFLEYEDGDSVRRSSRRKKKKKQPAPLQQQIMARERDDIKRERFKSKLRSRKSKEGEFLFNYAVQITKLKKVSRIIDDILSNFEHPGTNIIRMRRRSVFALEDEDEQNPPYIYSPGQRPFPPGMRQGTNLPPGSMYPSLAYQNMVWNQLALSYGMANSQNAQKQGKGPSTGQGKGAVNPNLKDLPYRHAMHPSAKNMIQQDAAKLLKDSETASYLRTTSLRGRRNESLSMFSSNRRNASRMVAAMKLRLFERIRQLQNRNLDDPEGSLDEMEDDELLFDGSNYSFQVRKRKGSSLIDIDLNENITKNEGCGSQINQGVSECVAFLLHLKSCFTNQRARESLVVIDAALLAMKPKTKDYETSILYEEISEVVERIKRRVIPYS